MWKGLEQHQFGIDLGTSNTLIYQKGKGIVLYEPSVMAIRKNTGEIEAVGQKAREMIGRVSHQIEIIYPLKDGVIANFEMVTLMLKHFFRKIQSSLWWFHRSRVVISVPCNITDVTKRAVVNLIVHKGAQKAELVEEPIAAALGAGLPVNEPVGSMVIDIGGGTSQIAILSMGGIVVSHCIQRGGVSIDLSVIEYIKKKYNLSIGERTAENIKESIGNAISRKDKQSFEIQGRDLVEGLPKTIFITEQEVHNLLNDFIRVILESIRKVIEQCPPELAGDIMDGGIMLCGGGSLLKGLDQRLQMETQIPVHLSENPLECIALGTGQLLL
jgi:rod shape-determining protein MreB